MKNWNDFTIHEQVEIVVMFITDKRDEITLAVQCSLERFLYSYGKMPIYGGREDSLVSVKQLDEWLIEGGFEEWYEDNLETFQDLELSEFPNVDYVFMREGWIVSHDGHDTVVERIDNVIEWKKDNGLDFLPVQLESDLDAIKLAERYGFEFGYDYKPNRVTRPSFSKH